MNREILQRVAEKWESENLEIVSSYSEEQIKIAFDKIGKSVSKDIMQVYTSLGSMNGNEIDSNLLSFWNLDQMMIENSSKHDSELVLFGDFLVYSHLYGYKYENENVSSVYSDFETGKYLKISDSVEGFFELYLTNPIEIGLYKE